MSEYDRDRKRRQTEGVTEQNIKLQYTNNKQQVVVDKRIK